MCCYFRWLGYAVAIIVLPGWKQSSHLVFNINVIAKFHLQLSQLRLNDPTGGTDRISKINDIDGFFKTLGFALIDGSKEMLGIFDMLGNNKIDHDGIIGILSVLNSSNYTLEELNIENPVYKTICQSVAIHFGKMF